MEIDIKDDRLFIDVSPVVDREDFGKEIERLRNVLRVRMPLTNDDSSTIPSKNEEKKIETEIEKSRKRLYLPVVFKSVIEAAVFRNRITDNDYSPVYLSCVQNGTFDEAGATPDETYSIVLSPGARDEDVIKAYQQYRDQLGAVKGVPEYKYIHQVWEVNKKKPSIKKYRRWYLDIKADYSIADIADDESSKCPHRLKDNHGKEDERPKDCTCYDESTIRKGIETYESLIWKTRTS